MKKIAGLFFRSFIKGLIILGPIGVTAYVLYFIFYSLDNLIPIPNLPAGTGFVIVLTFITIVGYLGTRFFVGKLIIDAFDNLLEHTPGIKYLYTAVKDVINSFVGDKRKFNTPVWVKTSVEPEIWRLGFLTQNDMSQLGFDAKVAVYLPHSYAISGWVIVTSGSNIKKVENMSAAEAMKFAVSGGVTINEEK